MSKKFSVTAVFMVLLSSQIQAELPKLNIITEQYQPYNFIDPEDSAQKVQGIAVDLFLDMLAKAGSTQTRDDIDLQTWGHGYWSLSELKGTVLFSTARTKEREDLFKWVCPISELKTEIIALKSANIKINDKSDLVKYRIGTVRYEVGEQLVVAAGVPLDDLIRTTQYENNLEKIVDSRLDLHVGSMVSVSAICNMTSCDASLFEPVYTLDVSQLCYAFHKDTDVTVIDSLQAALNELLTAGRLDELNKKYEKWR